MLHKTIRFRPREKHKDIQLAHEVLQVGAGGLTSDGVEHLLANAADLTLLGVGSLAKSVLALLGESNAENTEAEAVEGGHVSMSLDQGLPLADKRPQLVGGEIHAVEVGQDGAALNILDLEAHLAEGLILILLQIREVGLDDTALKSIGGDL
jgi:hypothetical protein